MSWSKVVLFGDSLTQRSFDPNFGYWGALLADKLQRVCDVVARGFSGYNTRYCKLVIGKVFDSIASDEIACVIILLGSNDASDPSSLTGQHVPLEEYSLNLAYMISYLEGRGVPRSRIIVMSPPNYFHDHFVQSCKQRGTTLHVKSDQQVKQYALACHKVAQQQLVTFLDLYTIFSSHPSSETLFMDGLHFSTNGAKLLFENLFPLVVEKVQAFAGQPLEKLINFPIWSEIDSENPQKSLE